MARRGLRGSRARRGLGGLTLRQEHWTRRTLEREALALNSQWAMALVRWVLQFRGPLMMQAASVRYWLRRRVEP